VDGKTLGQIRLAQVRTPGYAVDYKTAATKSQFKAAKPPLLPRQPINAESRRLIRSYVTQRTRMPTVTWANDK
jgi:hypothetical protein